MDNLTRGSVSIHPIARVVEVMWSWYGVVLMVSMEEWCLGLENPNLRSPYYRTVILYDVCTYVQWTFMTYTHLLYVYTVPTFIHVHAHITQYHDPSTQLHNSLHYRYKLRLVREEDHSTVLMFPSLLTSMINPSLKCLQGTHICYSAHHYYGIQ